MVTDKEQAIEGIKKKELSLLNISPQLREDEEIALEAVMQYGMSQITILQGTRIQGNPELWKKLIAIAKDKKKAKDNEKYEKKEDVFEEDLDAFSLPDEAYADMMREDNEYYNIGNEEDFDELYEDMNDLPDEAYADMENALREREQAERELEELIRESKVKELELAKVNENIRRLQPYKDKVEEIEKTEEEEYIR